MNTTSPTIGRKVRATTTTETEQAVVIEVTAIDREIESGWYVYGYRQYRTRRHMASSFPCLYFVARAS